MNRKVTDAQIEAEIADVLQHAPRRPGGKKFKVGMNVFISFDKCCWFIKLLIMRGKMLIY